MSRERARPEAERVSGPPGAGDLAATETFDYDDPAVRAWAWGVVGDAEDSALRARRLFAAVRDQVRYDPSGLDPTRSAFTASTVLVSKSNWCVPKAILLTAAARAVGIPARIGFADVRNHLSTEKLRARMGSDVFVFHGYVALHVGDGWRKVSPAFNAELCARFGVPALEFDGRSDALLHAYDGAGRRHMEYLIDRGTWSDVPFAAMFAAFQETYGRIDALAAQAPQEPAVGS